MRPDPLRVGRRPVLRLGLAAAFAGSRAGGAAGTTPSLGDAAARAGVLYGSDSDVPIAEAPAEYGALFVRHCRLFAPLMSWSAVCPRPCAAGEPGWEDPNIAFARGYGARLTGGHLLWYLRTPSWFTDLSREQAKAAASRHVTSMTSRYAGQIFSWNVVNEAIDPRDGHADGLRRSRLFDTLGAHYMTDAFHLAREADPHALLAYNDYGLEMDRPDHAARRAALLRLLDRLQSASAPIDAVGVQAHLRLDRSRFDETVFRTFLGEIAGRGLKLLITELDVFDMLAGPGIAARDGDVAAMYGAFLRATLDEPAVRAVVTWGLSDRYTWLTSENGENFVRPDRQPARPLPFDAAFRPKPAFFAMLDAFRSATARGSG